MDLPKPPEDAELKNIIDKLANFVARNGPEFEQMTKQKQQDNPKFSFLFGGENYSYYQYKVQTEQAIINVQKKKLQEQQEQQQQAALAAAQLAASQQLLQLQQQQQTQPVASQQLNQPITGQQLVTSQQIDVSQQLAAPPQLVGTQQITAPAPWQPAQQVTTSIPPASVISTTPIQTTVSVLTPQQQVTNFQQQIAVQQTQIQQHQTLMDQQIKTSEQNLAAQYQSLMQQQQAQIEDAIFNQQAEHLQTLSTDCELPLEDLDKTVKPIIDSCTKDAILTGKSWIFQNCTTDARSQLIAQYFLKRIISKEASFELRLHLIYLINDLLHHCTRKGADNLKKSLEEIVVAVFCTSLVGAGEDQKVKLNKLLALWEQNKYFDQEIIERGESLYHQQQIEQVVNHNTKLIF